jgi:hypothetical protein
VRCIISSDFVQFWVFLPSLARCLTYCLWTIMGIRDQCLRPGEYLICVSSSLKYVAYCEAIMRTTDTGLEFL